MNRFSLVPGHIFGSAAGNLRFSYRGIILIGAGCPAEPLPTGAAAFTYLFRGCFRPDLAKEKGLRSMNARTFRQIGFAVVVAFMMLALPLMSAHSQTLTTLCSFGRMNNRPGDLTLYGSTLYGATSFGGTYGYGSVFSVATSGGDPTTLCSFNGGNGSSPVAALTLSGSTLYGTTLYGGAHGFGTIFKINTDGSQFQDLVDFGLTDNGYNPAGSLAIDGSILYGTTQSGGVNGYGTAFALNLTPTPEPSSLALLGVGALGLIGYARRWRRAA